MHGSPAIRGLQSAGVCLLFAILCTANAAGYRYGVSDQAFYIPVVVRALEPAAYPRDAALIDAQGRLMLADEALATIVQTTGVSLETLFFVAYLASLALTWLALRAIGARVYTSGWGTMPCWRCSPCGIASRARARIRSNPTFIHGCWRLRSACSR